MRSKTILVLLLLAFSIAIFAKNVNLLFEDDFSHPQRSVKNWGARKSTALVENNILTLNPNLAKSVKLCLAGSEKWKNYTFSCKMKVLESIPGQSGQLGVIIGGAYIFTGSDEKNILWLNFKNLRARKLNSGKGQWHSLKLVYNSNRITIFVDNREISVISPVSGKGPICLRAYKLKGAFAEVKLVANTVDAKKSVTQNILLNNSFETKAASGIPDYWGTCDVGLRDEYWLAHRDELYKRWRLDTDNPFHGRQCMRIDAVPRLYSTMLNLKTGEQYTLSAYLRSNEDNMPVNIIVNNWRGKNWKKQVKLTQEWKRYVFSMPPVEKGKVFFGFVAADKKTKGVFWVDAVQLEKGEQASAYQASNDKESGKVFLKLPEVKASPADGKVTLDGSLNDKPWNGATKVMLPLRNGDTPDNKTECYLMYDSNNLYIGFKCYDSQMNKVKGNILKRDGFVWLDDSVELFINPSARENYYHLGVSVSGAQYDGLKNNPAWNGDWQAKTKKFKDRWECEIRIPFEIMGLSAFDSGDWRINLCRENKKAQEFSAWSPTYESGFHSKEHFGILKAFPKEITKNWDKDTAGTVKNYVPKPYALEVNGKPFLAFGIDWGSTRLPGKNAFAAMREANMNMLELVVRDTSIKNKFYSFADIKKMVDLAETYNIKVVIRVHKQGQPTEENIAVCREIMSGLKDHRNIIAWIVLDEPHVNPDMVKKIVKNARTLAPSKPVFINVTPQGLGMKIGGLPGDIICVDRYPVGFDGSTINDVGITAQKAVKLAESRKIPAWMFLQSMGNWLWVQKSVTPDELTAQAYEALIKGITGIIWFSGLPYPEKTWKRTISLGEEIKRLKPLFLSQDIRRISCSNQKISYVCKELDGSFYIIAVNPYYQSREASFDISSLKIGENCKVMDYLNNKDVNNKQGIINVRFRPLERICYRIETGK